MKKISEAKLVGVDNALEWNDRVGSQRWLSKEMIAICTTKEHPVAAYLDPAYALCQYKMKLNIFTFGKLSLHLPFTVIAPPVSVDEVGFAGDLNSLIDDRRLKKGLFLMLNLKQSDVAAIKSDLPVGKTLPSCILDCPFASFEAYLDALRSGYRRRIKSALKKGAGLQIRTIEPEEFDESLYELYLQVHHKSKYPLECLDIGFFKQADCAIDVFTHENQNLAFVMYLVDGDSLNFIFGGMDYDHRDEYDLYYNMLLHLVELGIENKVKAINFGQSAESTKCRIGCVLEERFMVAFSGNPLIMFLLKICAPMLEYKSAPLEYNVFKSRWRDI